MLEQNAAYFGASAALLCDGDEPLSHQRLWDQAAMTVPSLNRLGVGRGDRVAIVLPQGPDLAVTFLAVAAGATAAPLNPAYVRKEFLFYLEDLQARALILPKGSDSPARAAADSLGTPVIELVPGKNGAALSVRSRRPLDLRKRTTSRWYFTPRGRPPVQRWCRSRTPICSPPSGTSGRRCNSNRPTDASM